LADLIYYAAELTVYSIQGKPLSPAGIGRPEANLFCTTGRARVIFAKVYPLNFHLSFLSSPAEF
jgi:hypothetical protein